MPSGCGNPRGHRVTLVPDLIAHALSSFKAQYPFGQRLTPWRSPGDRQPLDAMDELRQQPGGFLDRDDVGYFAAQLVEDDPDLTAGQVGAQAEMGTPAAEAEMRIGVSGHVESPRIGEL